MLQYNHSCFIRVDQTYGGHLYLHIAPTQLCASQPAIMVKPAISCWWKPEFQMTMTSSVMMCNITEAVGKGCFCETVLAPVPQYPWAGYWILPAPLCWTVWRPALTALALCQVTIMIITIQHSLISVFFFCAVRRVEPDREQLWRDSGQGPHLHQILCSMVRLSFLEQVTFKSFLFTVDVSL